MFHRLRSDRFCDRHGEMHERHFHHHRAGRHAMGGHGSKLHRLFEHGELRMVLLALVERKPSHGYELIKAIEEASSGLYVPSPGVIYPTLTLLEEQDFLEAETSGKGRKNYRITDAGRAELAQHQTTVDVIFARLAGAGLRREGNLAEGIADTMHRLRCVLRGNMMRADLTQEQVERINQALLEALGRIEAEVATHDNAEEQA
ncbi:PadR family transcriptional regulator [Serratia rhizosphaerae]|uniref:PadR family transcriptional regulator n=1 Tax=Serratia sp. Tan611 TaxID=2773264 RepID=UPI000DA2E0DE|nr:Transcriptional regulator YqjI [Serratia sp. Tan611]SQJ26588.1 Transcriptional regulator YqjI [Serratia rubidaea]